MGPDIRPSSVPRSRSRGRSCRRDVRRERELPPVWRHRRLEQGRQAETAWRNLASTRDPSARGCRRWQTGQDGRRRARDGQGDDRTSCMRGGLRPYRRPSGDPRCGPSCRAPAERANRPSRAKADGETGSRMAFELAGAAAAPVRPGSPRRGSPTGRANPRCRLSHRAVSATDVTGPSCSQPAELEHRSRHSRGGPERSWPPRASAIRRPKPPPVAARRLMPLQLTEQAHGTAFSRGWDLRGGRDRSGWSPWFRQRVSFRLTGVRFEAPRPGMTAQVEPDHSSRTITGRVGGRGRAIPRRVGRAFRLVRLAASGRDGRQIEEGVASGGRIQNPPPATPDGIARMAASGQSRGASIIRKADSGPCSGSAGGWSTVEGSAIRSPGDRDGPPDTLRGRR